MYIFVINVKLLSFGLYVFNFYNLDSYYFIGVLFIWGWKLECVLWEWDFMVLLVYWVKE